MQKLTPIKNLLEKLIKEITKEEVDKAVGMSNKRRSEFKRQFKLREATNNQNDPNLDMNDVLSSAGALANDDPSQQPSDQTGGQVPPGNDPSGTAPLSDPDSSAEPKDPLEDITSTAKEMTKTTKDVPTILKAMKAKIQDNYKQLGDPKEVVKALQDTKDTTLQSVAQRLDAFLKAGK